MNIVIGLLKVLVVIDCLLMILVILMQRPRQEGLGAAFGSGVTDQMFGAQTTNVLQKVTTWLGGALFALTFFLAILIAKQDSANKAGSLVDPSDKAAAKTAPAAVAPAPAAAPEAKKDDKAAAPAAEKSADKAPEAKKEDKPAEKPAAPAVAPAPAPASAPAADKPAAAPAPTPAPAATTPAPATPAPAPAAPTEPKQN